MKRTLVAFLSALTFFSLNVAPVYAQFTLLPQAPEGADCQSLLDGYELTGKIPSPKEGAEAKAAEAKKTYNDYLATLDPIDLGDCVTGSGGSVNQDLKCDELKQASDQAASEAANASADPAGFEALLGCAIKTGRLSLQMIPYFISYFANWILGLSGLVAMLFIVIGGFMYIYGGLTDQKEKGKKYIFNALLGMVLALLAWTIVSVIIVAVTS